MPSSVKRHRVSMEHKWLSSSGCCSSEHAKMSKNAGNEHGWMYVNMQTIPAWSVRSVHYDMLVPPNFIHAFDKYLPLASGSRSPEQIPVGAQGGACLVHTCVVLHCQLNIKCLVHVDFPVIV